MEECMKDTGRITICMGVEITFGRPEGNMKVDYRIFKFIGEYYMDKKHGRGVYTWADQRKYDGLWANGKQHGEGKYVLPDGTIRYGQWEEGRRVKWMDANDGRRMNFKSSATSTPKKQLGGDSAIADTKGNTTTKEM